MFCNYQKSIYGKTDSGCYYKSGYNHSDTRYLPGNRFQRCSLFTTGKPNIEPCRPMV